MGAANEFVDSYLAAWNAHSPIAIIDHFCREGSYRDVPQQRELKRDALRDYLEDFFSRDRHHYELVGEVLANGNSMAFQYRALSIDSTTGEARQSWHGAEFIELAEGGALVVTDYYRLPEGAANRAGAATRYARSGLGEAAMKTLLARLGSLMERDRIYLDPDLSLPRLAETLGTSVNHLSQAINAGHGLGFFDYINGYRIREAQVLLRKGGGTGAVLDIALAVGFNSTSTFYNAFKKSTGETPARYRRRFL